MNLFWHKIICSALLLVSAALGYILPYKVNSSEKSRGPKSKVLSILKAFGAGAFIALALVHLIPDAIEDSSGGKLSIRIADTEVNGVCYFILSGFLLSLLSESIADEIFGENHHGYHDHASPSSTNPTLSKDNLNSNVISTNVSEYSSDEDSCIVQELDNGISVEKKKDTLLDLSDTEREGLKKKRTKLCDNKSLDVGFNSNHNSFSIGFVLVCALFFHSLFEGMIVGTSKNIMGTWLVTCVVFAHKWIEILIVYVTFSARGINPLIYVIFLSLGSPLGAIIGAVVIISNSIASAVCSALAAGTILYVACIEVIPEVFKEKSNISIVPKLSSFIVGILTVSILTLVGEVVENSY
ncbi:metal cation transporter, ZIP family protein [Cryptosporidium felis]|nr:metal cation transporter, ZIP family protein [Cryptosporidium felis]